MENPMVMRHSYSRTALAGPGKIAAAALIGIALSLVYLQIALIGQVIPPLAIFAVVALIMAGTVWAGWRWAPVLAAIWSLFIVAGNAEHVRYNLTHPDDAHSFAFTTMLLGIAAVGLISGIGATLQNYRRAADARRMPRWGRYGLVGLVGVAAGAILAVALPQTGTAAGVSPEALASLPALTTANFSFDQPELRAKVGETVALRLENRDRDAHSFDLDAFDVHAPMLSGARSVALFRPDRAGEYAFYCGVPGHDETMRGTLIVTP